jgi:hypothetical protein
MQTIRPSFLALTLAALAVSLPVAVYAAPRAFNLPAQPLAVSLKAVAASAGLRLTVQDRLIAGEMAPKLQGRYEPTVALQRLLRSSGLVLAVAGGSATVSEAPPRVSLFADGVTSVAPRANHPATPLVLAPADDAAGQVPLVAQLTDAPPPAATNPIYAYFANWQARVEQAQASQPHWMTPLVTVTPRLEQEVRYDQYWETRGNGSTLDIYDAGKGLELIPTGTNEVLINPPAYQYKENTKHPANGWLDDQFLVVKQRLLSANEQSGNYIVTAFLGLTAGSGNATFTNNTWIVTPTIAAGAGWGDFDVQATMGANIPFENQSTLGTSIPINVAFQYHLLTYFWPEFEVNDTYWIDGKERGGKDQVLLTPGVILGRFVIKDRLKVIIGGGYQFAVSPHYVDTTEQTPTYNHAWIVSARAAF